MDVAGMGMWPLCFPDTLEKPKLQPPFLAD
jgi:hypothetical protein